MMSIATEDKELSIPQITKAEMDEAIAVLASISLENTEVARDKGMPEVEHADRGS